MEPRTPHGRLWRRPRAGARMRAALLLGPAALLLVPSAALPEAAAPPTDAPALVLLLAVDQLGRDRLDPGLPGGLGRLAREGRVFTRAVVDHATTETCPGHAALASGRHPGAMGVPENLFIDRDRGERVYCVEDDAADARVFGSPLRRSPRLLRGDALGDWLRARHPESRVFSVSGKDRAAITLGGKSADAAFWFQWEEGTPGFTSSGYYLPERPAWLRAWNGREPPADGFWARLPDAWRPAPALEAPGARPDDFPAESDRWGRTGPRPLRDDDPRTFAERLWHAPHLDELTLELASRLVSRHRLGRGPAPDLLAVSLTATDTVGHLYGPESAEARDALRRTDAALGRFLDGLREALGGDDRLLVALSSDHGVLPLPEWLAATDRSACPVEGGRVGLTWLAVKLFWRLHRSLAPLLSWPAEWLHFAGYNATVNRSVTAERDVPVQRVVAVTEEHLEAEPGVAEVWTRPEILEGTSELAELYRHSFDPERSGDLVVQPEATCLIHPRDHGTTHGTPYAYDREVPVVFWGAGVEPGRVDGPARTVDVAPTLAEALGLELPDDLDGRPLSLAGEGS